MNRKISSSLVALLLLSGGSSSQAGEKEELLKLRHTTTNLIQMLVKQGVLTQENANVMIKQAEVDAEEQARLEAEKNQLEPGEVRVAYVPEHIKDEIRRQVKAELRADVVSDVMAQAKTQQWGVPNALPEWTRRIKFYGDMRLRYQNDSFADSNIAGSYFDWQRINDKGGITKAGRDAFLNTIEDRQRFRARLRLGIDAQVTAGLKAGLRLTTGNLRNPVSTNQTFGNSGNRWDVVLDRAFLEYKAQNSDGYNWLKLAGGRIKNPWFSTDLVWDKDLGFEGVAGTVYYNLAGSGSLADISDTSRTLFLTAGAFPLQEDELSTTDKWLFGGQVGLDWQFANQDHLKVGVAYYDYYKIEAQPNIEIPNTCDLNTEKNNASIPDRLEKGNSLAEICREGSSTDPGEFSGLVGLASDYNILNITAQYDIARFAPYHIILTADYAKNLGYDQADILNRTGETIEEQTDAWQFKVQYGWPRADYPGHWNIFTAYKYIERDAVLDIFTDSDFHLGGTDAKGWIIGANYGLMENVWLTARWMSTDEIDGPPLGIDVLQVDLNAKF